MAFINLEYQLLFFHLQNIRRSKRESVGCIAPDIHQEKIDNCLDMILCHDPDVWCYGTGVLLVAPNVLLTKQSLSQTRATDMRKEVMREHFFEREFLRSIEESCFGYFVRTSIECLDRTRSMSCDAEYEGINLPDDESLIINYVENNISTVINKFSLQADKSRRIGIRKYGLCFDTYRNITKGHTDYQILDQLEEFTRGSIPRYIRLLFLNTFPDFVDQFPVARELSFELEDDEIFPNHDDYTNFPNHLPDMVKTIGECVVCYTDGNVLEWPCHTSHILCKECTDKVFSSGALCPLCRTHICLS